MRFQLSELKAISALAGEMIHARLLPHSTLSAIRESVGWTIWRDHPADVGRQLLIDDRT